MGKDHNGRISKGVFASIAAAERQSVAVALNSVLAFNKFDTFAMDLPNAAARLQERRINVRHMYSRIGSGCCQAACALCGNLPAAAQGILVEHSS